MLIDKRVKRILRNQDTELSIEYLNMLEEADTGKIWNKILFESNSGWFLMLSLSVLSLATLAYFFFDVDFAWVVNASAGFIVCYLFCERFNRNYFRILKQKKRIEELYLVYEAQQYLKEKGE